MAEFRMPSLGADMTAGTLIRWLKEPGEKVERGDIIAEVDTDKGVIEIEVFTDGVLGRQLVEPGTKVPVGTSLAIINGEGEAPSAGTASSGVKKEPEERTRVLASPSARKLADKLGIDIVDLEGSGPGGRIQREDVERAAARSPEKETAETTSEDRFRRAIAAAMERSKREIPHYYLSTTVPFENALSWLERENSARPVRERLLHNVLLVKAVALAVKELPEFNGFWTGGRLEISERINIGFAISMRQGGLAAPAIHDAETKSLSELMEELRDLVARARSGTLRSSELSDPTITLTNLGDQGVETAFGIIYPPQVALVAFGRIFEGVSFEDGMVRPCRSINATLSADHRASDGHRGGLFLAAISRLLQTPEDL
ncbi:MAG: 2-oxo acid dehydrogenase subunit E2 [Acidobacteriota bacterium]|nr:MAG: 2-oxo acid dehydrogenase subunit E2 [Acidobacteriota bacterium]